MSTVKKRTAKKHDPKQLFTIMTVDRETIADMLNSAAEVTGKELEEEFTPTDPRLTDKVCQDIADTLYDAYTNNADEELDAAEKDVYIDYLENF